jgi:predicted enzyme related to lactoylglutathione lyase
MAKILGIGGVFFKAADPDGLRAWYKEILGFDVTDWGGTVFPPLPRGKTVWSPFPDNTDYFAPSTHPFMINLVVDDMDGMLATLATHGIPILGQQTMESMGRFAWITDPAGTKLELWEPA